MDMVLFFHYYFLYLSWHIHKLHLFVGVVMSPCLLIVTVLVKAMETWMLCLPSLSGPTLPCSAISDRSTDVVDSCATGSWELVTENYNLRNGRKKYALGDSCILYLNIQDILGSLWIALIFFLSCLEGQYKM